MPTRFLFYVSRLFDGMVRHEQLYSSQKKLIPVPEFVVFYNGWKEQPERQVLRLSELYSYQAGDPERLSFEEQGGGDQYGA